MKRVGGNPDNFRECQTKFIYAKGQHSQDKLNTTVNKPIN